MAITFVVFGCNRYELRPLDPRECPPEPPPRDTVALTSTPAIPRTVVGVVTDDRSGHTVDGAQVAVTALRRGSLSDSTGAFRIDTLPPGTYELLVRRIGYDARRIAGVRVDDDVGASARIPLHGVVMDGCPGFMAKRVRLPWWKWW